MKDYLSTDERDDILLCNKLIDKAEEMVKEWDERGNLTKEERKSFKMMVSWGLKAFESIIFRQNNSSLLALEKAKRNYKIILDLKSITDTYIKKKMATIDAAYEDSKEYYNAVELLLHYNCRNCERKCIECDIYKHFEESYIPEFDLYEKLPNCKYAYKKEALS